MRLFRPLPKILEKPEQIPIRVRRHKLAVSDFARVASIPVFFQRQLDDSASRGIQAAIWHCVRVIEARTRCAPACDDDCGDGVLLILVVLQCAFLFATEYGPFGRRFWETRGPRSLEPECMRSMAEGAIAALWKTVEARAGGARARFYVVVARRPDRSSRRAASHELAIGRGAIL